MHGRSRSLGPVWRHYPSATAEDVHAVRRWTADLARRCGIPEEAVAALELVVSELATNALTYAGPGPMGVRVHGEGAFLLVEVYDHACPERRFPRRVSESEFSESGRGLHLVHSLATCWGVRRVLNSRRYGKFVYADLDAAVLSRIPGHGAVPPGAAVP